VALSYSEGGFAPLPNLPPTADCAGKSPRSKRNTTYLAPSITEDSMRISNQKQAGVVKGDFPYDKAVAVQFKAAWDQ